MLPPAVAAEIEATLEQNSEEVTRLGGGCISPAARLQTDTGASWFVKWTERGKGRMLAAEAFALERIAETGTIRVPAVQAYGSQWLLLEWLKPATPGVQAWSDFGRALAALHRVRAQDFGWPEANFIGTLPQQNQQSDNWPEFWRSQRLEPQLSHASDAGLLGRKDVDQFQQLFAMLDQLLQVAHDVGASLLHGDLWGGNAHATAAGIAAIDPSSYYGHREVDLAMAQLFGGFPARFRSAYDEAWPLKRDGFARRQAIYQLYYLLVHVNLFGGSYTASVRSTLGEALAD